MIEAEGSSSHLGSAHGSCASGKHIPITSRNRTERSAQHTTAVPRQRYEEQHHSAASCACYDPRDRTTIVDTQQMCMIAVGTRQFDIPVWNITELSVEIATTGHLAFHSTSATSASTTTLTCRSSAVATTVSGPPHCYQSVPATAPCPPPHPPAPAVPARTARTRGSSAGTTTTTACAD